MAEMFVIPVVHAKALMNVPANTFKTFLFLFLDCG